MIGKQNYGDIILNEIELIFCTQLIGLVFVSYIVGYLMPNIIFTYILNISFVNIFCRYTQLNDVTIQFSMSFVCPQFKCQTVLFDRIRCYHTGPD